MREEFEKVFPVPHGVVWNQDAEWYAGISREYYPDADDYQLSWAVWQAATALQAERVRELEILLKVAACPSSCIGGAYHGPHGEPVQCQFCYEREQALSATAREVGE